MILSVGSYRLCENSLKVSYFPLEERSHAGANRGISGPRAISLLLYLWFPDLFEPASARSYFSGHLTKYRCSRREKVVRGRGGQTRQGPAGVSVSFGNPYFVCLLVLFW